MLEELLKYMLDKNNINKWENNIIEIKQHPKKEFVKEKSINLDKKINTYTHFKENDPFFWCLFFILNGEFKYMIEKSNFSTEKLFKIQLVQKIRENKKQLKKLKFNTNYIEDKLINSISIDYITFIAICIVYNINFILNEGFFYWENISNSDVTYIIQSINKETRIYIGDNNDNEINKIKKNFIKSEYNKKIKSISNYKLNDLIDISKKMKIDLCKENGKKKKKKELYSEIQQLI